VFGTPAYPESPVRYTPWAHRMKLFTSGCACPCSKCQSGISLLSLAAAWPSAGPHLKAIAVASLSQPERQYTTSWSLNQWYGSMDAIGIEESEGSRQASVHHSSWPVCPSDRIHSAAP